MNKEIFLTIVFLSSFLSIQAQESKLKKIVLSNNEEINIDSIVFYDPILELEPITIDKFQPELISTPEKALQTFLSFRTKEVAQLLATEEYTEYFPSDETIKSRNDSTYITKRYLKIYFTVYYQYMDESHSSCYFETYANEEYPEYINMINYKMDKNRWLLVDNRNLSKYKSIGDFKPQFAKKIILGEKHESNELYNELFFQVYTNGVLDAEKLNSLMPIYVLIPEGIKNTKYKSLLN